MPVCLIAEPIHAVGVERLQAAGFTVRLASTPQLEDIESELADVDTIIVRSTLTAKAMDLAPRLSFIANHGTGTDGVDVDHANTLGIPVAVTPSTNTQSVAEHAIMLMLATSRHLVEAHAATQRGNAKFRFDVPFIALQGKALGIVGYGRVGRSVAQLASAFGMNVTFWAPLEEQAQAPGIKFSTSLESLFETSDFVTLHCPLLPETQYMINDESLEKFKHGATLINTSRGGLVEEHALAKALRSGRLRAAGLDVLEHEPMTTDSPLHDAVGLVLTPHSAGSTQDALYATAVQCADNIISAFSDVKPTHLKNDDVWINRRRLDGASI